MAQFRPPTDGLFYDPEFGKRTFLALNNQRSVSQFCDVVLRVCGTQIYAHSNVLAAASPYFGSFLGVGTDSPRVFSQKMPQIIEIHIDTKDGDDGYGEAVCKVIEYMYTSEITLNASVVSQVVEICKIMQMDTLLQFCGRFQSGDDNNCPQEKSTSTAGLEEIVNLMGPRVYGMKRIDAATVTEDSIFQKLESSTSLQNIDSMSLNFDTCQPHADNISVKIQSTMPESGQSAQDVFFVSDQATSKCHEEDGSENPVIGFDADTEQTDASLLLSIGKVHPNIGSIPSNNPTQLESLNPDTSHNDHVENNCQYKTSHSQQQISDDYLKNVQTLADMINFTVDKGEEPCLSNSASDSQCEHLINKGTQSFSEKYIDSGKDEETKAKDLNLEEISDLMKFPLTAASKRTGRPYVKTTGLFISSTSKSHRQGRGRGRGQSKRKPGRPRKVVEQDSDPEFEDFIDRLEKGDEVHDNDGNDSTQNGAESVSQIHEYEINCHENYMIDGESVSESVKLWKSSRKRSRPRLLHKDYVVHSLKKRVNRRNTSAMLKDKLFNESEVSTENVPMGLEFVCQKCDYTTSVFKEYRKHLKMHPETDPRNFICLKEGCNFKTTRSREFTAHKQKHMIEQLICPICEYQAKYQGDFDIHLSKHEGDYPYFCMECDSRFRTKAQLLAHKPKHQLEKPFVCGICGGGFKWKHALKNHMVIHSASKDHLCEECGYATARKSQLKAHMLIHTGLMFRCPAPGCTFQATKRQNIKYHMVTHTQEKAHQCDICGQSFTLIKNMRRHMLLHTGARRLSCRLCGYSTTRYDKLKEHNQKLHNIGDCSVVGSQNSACAPQLQMVFAGDPDIQPPIMQPDITYVSTTDDGGITIANATEVSTISHETLQTIAQLAGGQSYSDTTIIQEEGSDSSMIPVITTVEFCPEGADGISYEPS